VDKYPVAVGLALLLGDGRVLAASPEPLTVSLTECPRAPVGATAFLAALELELDPSQRPMVSRNEARAGIAVRVDCDGRVSIRIDATEERREIRVDDVPAADRPRVIALVVAELVRTGAPRASSRPDPQDERASASPTQSLNANGAAPDVEPKPSLGPPLRDSLRPWIGAWAHASVGAANGIYGGAAGIDWHRSRFQVELGLAYAERARGSITAGLAAGRYRHSLRLVGGSKLALNAALSGALGVTWATGASQTPGVVVRRVLSPYADGRVELALRLWLAERILPELGVYSGGAAGLLATNQGQDVLSSGGWLLGIGIGSTF
jgi:hypothetical protein